MSEIELFDETKDEEPPFWGPRDRLSQMEREEASPLIEHLRAALNEYLAIHPVSGPDISVHALRVLELAVIGEAQEQHEAMRA